MPWRGSLRKRRGGSIESSSKIYGDNSVKMTLDKFGTKGFADVQENYMTVVQSLY